MSDEKQKEASAKIAEKLNQITELYKECAKIANEAGVDFSYSGPAGYGDGGWYTPQNEEWESSDAGWQASSNSC